MLTKKASTSHAILQIRHKMTGGDSYKYQGNMIVQLANKLKSNLEFDCGFRISRYDTLSTDFCYCPLSTKFNNLHAMFNMEDCFGVAGELVCSTQFAMNPRQSIVYHLSKRQTSFYHDMIYEYLNKLYGNQCLSGVKHEALYCSNTQKMYQAYQI